MLWKKGLSNSDVQSFKLTADGRKRTPFGYHREATVRVIPRVSAVK
jgi:hypothetical protein